MISFTKPLNLNGAELLAELQAAGFKVTTNPIIDGNQVLWLDLDPDDQTKASNIVAEHNGTIVAVEPTVAQKLASVGLSIDELKAALLA